MAAFEEILNLEEFESIARERMEQSAFDFFAGGAWGEVTLRENIAAIRRRRLRPRVLVDVSTISTATEMLGSPVSMPVALAPAALQRLCHPDGELAVARAAEAAQVPFCVATMSSCSVEEVRAAASGSLWFQLYVHKDRSISRALVERAVESRYDAIVLTVDAPVAAYRERELRSGFRFPDAGFGNLKSVRTGGEELIPLFTEMQDQSLTWDDLAWLRSITELPLVTKGILTGEDAELAVEAGASGVVVSNHGGRQLDVVPASIDVLEEVVEAVADRAEVYLDGGIRRGTDVLVAIALGARGVLVGRPYLFALAAGGQEGVSRALRLLAAEIRTAMALLGAPSVESIGRSHVR
jgi:isopentenyl diphosphate isomerase/L-lactate dehydrogenase-like FMN-dependent dehydrogenase